MFLTTSTNKSTKKENVSSINSASITNIYTEKSIATLSISNKVEGTELTYPSNK